MNERWSELFAFFWHPVCTVDELNATRDRQVVGARLLGRDLAVARLGPTEISAVTDRCPHRSTRLSVGSVENGRLTCAYHGWGFDSDGRCQSIPSLGDEATIPPTACTTAFRTTIEHGLVWVLIDDRLDPPIPACPSFGDAELRVLTPDPYTWPTSAPRRVENFVDLAHFAFVHDGSLGSRSEPIPPIPAIERREGELRFHYDPPDLRTAPTAMFGSSAYRMPMPLTVDIQFAIAGGARRTLWMTASPVDDHSCRSFWMIGRSDDQDPVADMRHLEFQRQVLAEDEPVVCNQVPPSIDLTPGAEVSVRTDRVSLEYRRWLGAMLDAVDDVDRLRDIVSAAVPTPAVV